MQRLIKFRAWDLKENRWSVLADYINLESGEAGFVDGDGCLDPHISEQTILTQYTGLKDKNGVEIYEGDIVVQDGYIWFDDSEPNYRGTVEWVYSQWQVITHCINPNKRGISDGMNVGLNDDGIDEGLKSPWEVIGNIYENHELLEANQ